MASKPLSQRLIDEAPLRKIACAIILLVVGIPAIGLFVTDVLIVLRSNSISVPQAQPLFDFLQIPFSDSLSSLGFVVTTLVPGIVAVVCYGINQTTQPWSSTSELSKVGYIVLILCLVGVTVGFISLVVVTVCEQYVKELTTTDKGVASIHALVTATMAFYGFYIVQLMGFDPK
ncbi:hypothetical protein ACQZ6F_29395 [Rhizobium sp. A22-96]